MKISSANFFFGCKSRDTLLRSHWCPTHFILLNRVTRLGNLSPFGRLFKAFGDNLFGPNGPNFWGLYGRFFKVGQNLKFLCYKIIFIAVNLKKNIILKFFQNKLGNFCSKKDPKYAFLTTKTSKNPRPRINRLRMPNFLVGLLNA